MDDDKTQKERLEQELRFLKESFEAEVISKEEFEKGKDRIEKKLKEIKEPENKQPKEEKKEQTQELQEPIKGIIGKKEETKTAEAISKEGEKIKLKVIQDEAVQHFEPVQIKVQPAEKIEEKAEEPKKEYKADEKSKFFKYAVIFIVLVLIVFFSYSFIKESSLKSQEKTSQVKFIAACSSNDDCKQEGKEGFCLNAGAKDAKCDFKEIPKTNIIILNDRKNCFNCGTQRVLTILEEWFGAVNSKEINYTTDEGKNLAEKFNAKALPMYILDENITKKPKFEQFKQTFVKRGDNYVLSEDASGSTFYFRRENIPNKLDLFVIDGDDASIKAENNLKEFLDAFKEVKFEKHLSIDKLTQELNIKTFPTFLVNNRVKFSGVHTAETIKNNFCKLNAVLGCEKSLSKSLV